MLPAPINVLIKSVLKYSHNEMVDNLMEIDEHKAKIRSKIVAISVVFEQVMKMSSY